MHLLFLFSILGLKPKIQHLCNDCNEEFSSGSGLRKHIKEIHMFKCKKCDRYYVTKIKMVQHMKNFHRKNQNKICKICERSFLSENDLAKHISVKHDIHSKQYSESNICDKGRT